MTSDDTGLTYAAAGVDIEAGELAVSKIRAKVQSTFSSEVVADIGGFAGMFAPNIGDLKEPVLVSSTDGVGTKAMVARMANRYDTIGIDLVAMCVDDLVCTGARPLFMLDYISIGKLDPAQIENLVGGIAEGCLKAKTSLIGGEMAEHPSGMEDGDFDLAGFAVGVVDRQAVWGSHRVRPGQTVIGLASPNLRSNGFSLARAALFGDSTPAAIRARGLEPSWENSRVSLFDVLLEPSVIYSHAISSLPNREVVASCAHITGGGIEGNLPRSLPCDVGAELNLSSVEVPRIFYEISSRGPVSEEEMYKVFNMGVGMMLVVEPDAESEIRRHIETFSIATYGLGKTIQNGGRLDFV